MDYSQATTLNSSVRIFVLTLGFVSNAADMATLGLGAYSSSDSEDDSGRATLATGEEAAPPAGPSTAAKAPARADANRPIDRTGTIVDTAFFVCSDSEVVRVR